MLPHRRNTKIAAPARSWPRRRSVRRILGRDVAAAVARATVMGLALSVLGIQPGFHAQGAPRQGSGAAKLGSATSPETTEKIESSLEPFFARKDLWSLDERAGSREAAKLLGTDAAPGSVHWYLVPRRGEPLRVLTVDLGAAAGSSPGAAQGGYVAYAIVEPAPGGSPNVSWYHDLGRKITEQGGEAWHPVGVVWMGGDVPEATLGVVSAAKPEGAAVGVLVLEQRSGAWSAARRLSAGASGRLIGVGREGAVFLVPRPVPRGVLTGAPPELFRAVALFDRTPDGFSAEPILAPVPEVVTATEAIMAALRRADLDEAKRLCTAPDVVEALQYFTPTWKGGGRIVKTGPTSLEMIYEERERPTLHLELTYQNRGGHLLLASATGKAEGGKP